MKNVVALVFVCSLALSMAVGQSSGMSAGDEIAKMEKDWGQAILANPIAAIDQYEADDIVSTDVSGRVTDKAQDKKDMLSGDIKYESLDLREIKVHDYGDFAVATGLTNGKGSYKGKPFSGTYRFTDTWAKRNGKWQCVAEHATKVEQ